MSKRSGKNKCGPGEIMRVGYRRKGYQRNEYIRKDGTVVPATYVSATYVPPTCIKDMGRPGKGPKTLPKPNNFIHLSKYGYSIYKPEKQRRAALRAAIKDYNTLSILRRLNLLRNYQAIPENKEIFTKDVEYLKHLYSNIRKSRPKKKNKNIQRGGFSSFWKKSINFNTEKFSMILDDNRKQYGGNGSLFQDPVNLDSIETSTTSDDNGYEEESKIEINTIIDKQKVCDAEGKCGVRNIIYEKHVVDGKTVIFYTLGETDIDQVLELDKIYLDPNIDRETVMQKIINNRGLLIGIKVDDKLEGYCHYEPLDNFEVSIEWFCANKGSGTPLYLFMEKYFKMNDYTRVILAVNLEGPNSTRRINFWYSMGFSTYETLPDQKKVLMEKFI